MRRKDREITDKEILEEILQQGTICSLALVDGEIPYVVPMSYGYCNNTLYLHSATTGKKIDLIKKNNNVCFNVVNSAKVELGPTPCKSTMRYTSIIGFGKAYFVDDPEEKKLGLDSIMKQHGWKMETKPIDYYALASVQVIKIKIESLTGKSNQ